MIRTMVKIGFWALVTAVAAGCLTGCRGIPANANFSQERLDNCRTEYTITWIGIDDKPECQVAQPQAEPAETPNASDGRTMLPVRRPVQCWRKVPGSGPPRIVAVEGPDGEPASLSIRVRDRKPLP